MAADLTIRLRTHATHRLSISLMLCFLWTCSTAGAEDAKQEMEKLQGNWIIVSAETKGKPVNPYYLSDIRRAVKGDEITWQVEGDVFLRTRFKIDPAHSPKRWDARLTWIDEGEEEEVESRLGIYELKDNVLKICVAGPNDERPTVLATKPNSDGMLVVLRRE